MEIGYRRELGHNYMIPDMELKTENEYALHMLADNDLEHFLPVELHRLNGELQLRYRIDSCQPMTRLFEKQGLASQDLARLFAGLEEAAREAQRFLLDPSDVVLLPECIYMDPGSKAPRFCFLPGFSNEEESASALAEYILKHLKHDDPGAVAYGYRFYELVSQRTGSMIWLIEQMQELHGQSAGEAAEENGRTVGEVRNREERTVKGKNRAEEMKELSWSEFAIPDNTGTEEKKDSFYRRITKSSRHKKTRMRIGVLAALVAVILPPTLALSMGWLDLTEAGGLTFLIISVGWLTISSIRNRREKPVNVWDDDPEEYSNEEEAFLEALMQDMYDTPQEAGIAEQSRGPGAKTGRMDPLSQAGFYEPMERNSGRWDKKNEKETADRESEEGQTRCLTENEGMERLCLVSLNPRRCPDLVLQTSRAIIGKKSDQVDLCISSDTISRLHACLEQTVGNEYYLTDLNSRNGTYVTAKGADGRMEAERQLVPNERYEVHEGDRIRFAGISFRLTLRNVEYR